MVVMRDYMVLGYTWDYVSADWHPPTHLVVVPCPIIEGLEEYNESFDWGISMYDEAFMSALLESSSLLDIGSFIPQWNDCLSDLKTGLLARTDLSELCDSIKMTFADERKCDFVASLLYSAYTLGSLYNLFEYDHGRLIVKHVYADVSTYEDINFALADGFNRADPEFFAKDTGLPFDMPVNVVARLASRWSVGMIAAQYEGVADGGYYADVLHNAFSNRHIRYDSNLALPGITTYHSHQSLGASSIPLRRDYLLDIFSSMNENGSMSLMLRFHDALDLRLAKASSGREDMSARSDMQWARAKTVVIHLDDCRNLNEMTRSPFYRLCCECLIIEGNGLNCITRSRNYFKCTRTNSDLDLRGYFRQVKDFACTFGDDMEVRDTVALVKGEVKLDDSVSSVENWVLGFNQLNCQLLDLRGIKFNPNAQFIGPVDTLEILSIFSNLTCDCLRIDAETFENVDLSLLFKKFSGNVEVYGANAEQFIDRVKDTGYLNTSMKISLGTAPRKVSEPVDEGTTLDLSAFESSVEDAPELDDEDMYLAVAFRLDNSVDSCGISEIGFINMEDISSVDFAFDTSKIIFKPVSEMHGVSGEEPNVKMSANAFLTDLFNLDQVPAFANRGMRFSSCPVLLYIGDELVSYTQMVLYRHALRSGALYAQLSYTYTLKMCPLTMLWYSDGALHASLMEPANMYGDIGLSPAMRESMLLDDYPYFVQIYYDLNGITRLYDSLCNFVLGYFGANAGVTDISSDKLGYRIYSPSQDAVCAPAGGIDLLDSAALQEAMLRSGERKTGYKLYLSSNIKGIFGGSMSLIAADQYDISVYWTPILSGHCLDWNLGLDTRFAFTRQAQPNLINTVFPQYGYKSIDDKELAGLDISYAQDISGLFANLGHLDVLDLRSLKFTKHVWADKLFFGTSVDELYLPPEFGYCASMCMVAAHDATASPLATFAHVGKLDLTGIKVNEKFYYNAFLRDAKIDYLVLDADDFIGLKNWAYVVAIMLMSVESKDVTLLLPEDEELVAKLKEAIPLDAASIRDKVHFKSRIRL